MITSFITTLEMLAEINGRRESSVVGHLLDAQYRIDALRIGLRWRTSKVKPKKCSMHEGWNEPVRWPELLSEQKPDAKPPKKPYLSLASRVKAIAAKRSA